MVALTVLVIIFLVLLAAGLLIFASFFIINKIYLKKLTTLMERYNRLSSSVYSINFFKIEVLIKNDLPIKLDLSQLKSTYAKVSDNITRICENLYTITEEINVFNLKTASKHLKSTAEDISKAEKDMKVIKSQYDKYTSYGDAIDELAQSYEDIYESLYNFFWSKVTYAKHFKQIQDLFLSISHTISQIPDFKHKFDFTKTTNLLLDLRKKITTLVMALEGIVKFQAIAEYLRRSMEVSDLEINHAFKTIDSQDLQMLKKQQNSFKKNFMEFMKAYLVLNMTEAKKFAIASCDSCHQIKNFVMVHTTTQNLIDVSLGEIDKQTDTILSNEQQIKTSLNTIAKYFIKDTVITTSFKEIINDIDVIKKLSVSSKAINSKTYSQKLDALKQISVISKSIYDRKDNIKKRIDEINLTLSKVIQIVTELNDLYIYFYQLLTLIKKIAPEDEQTKDIEILINNNLKLLNDYAREIIEVEHPDYKTISKNVFNMNDNVTQLSNHLKSANLIKMYATKLVVYSNRYRGSRENAPFFANITKLYKSKQYAKCIDILIPFIKNIKKQKKSKQTENKK